MEKRVKVFLTAALCAFLFAASGCGAMSEIDCTGTSEVVGRMAGGEANDALVQTMCFVRSDEPQERVVSFLEVSDAEGLCSSWGLSAKVEGFSVRHAALELSPVNESADLDEVSGAEFIYSDPNGASVMVEIVESGYEPDTDKAVHIAFLIDSENRIVVISCDGETGGIPDAFLTELLLD